MQSLSKKDRERKILYPFSAYKGYRSIADALKELFLFDLCEVVGCLAAEDNR